MTRAASVLGKFPGKIPSSGSSTSRVDAKGKSMIRTRLGLLLALLLVPAMPITAMAAPAPKGGGKNPAQGGGKDPKGQPPTDAKPADAKPVEAKPADAPPAEAPKEEPIETDPCKLDPDGELCQQQKDLEAMINKAAEGEVKAQMYAVQQIYVKRKGRFELNPYWSFTLNDQFVSHPGPGVALNYYITNVLAVGANFNYYHSLNQDSSFNADVRRAARVAVPLTEYDWSAALNFTYVPVYGKFAGFGDFIFHYDLYVVGGVGALANKPIAVVDPDNRTFDSKTKLAFNAGLGLRIFFNRWFAATLELRDYIFNDELEATTIAANPRLVGDKSTWYGNSQLTNNVQAQLGVSVFIPFGFDYRLPK